MHDHFTTKTRRKVILQVALSGLAIITLSGCGTNSSEGIKTTTIEKLSTPETYTGRRLSLQTLIISTGTTEDDLALVLMKDLHDRMGVPYEILNSRTEQLTKSRLSSGNHGNYNAIILTDAGLWDDNSIGKSGFSAEEWHILHDYERTFSVRESVLGGYPETNAALGLDYGLEKTKTFTLSFTGVWQPPAGKTELFEKINTANPLLLTGVATGAEARQETPGPRVQPLLTEQGSGKILIALLHYSDGREVLFSGITNTPYYLHSQLLAYEFLNFASKGVFIGARHVYLNAHIDDVFFPDHLWDPDTNTTDLNRTYRMSPHDVENTISSLNRLQAQYPTARGLKLDLAFNGEFSKNRMTVEDELYQAFSLHNSNSDFRYINHTLTHRNMNKSMGTTYQQAKYEIEQNRLVWQQLNLAELVENSTVLISGEHSGLRDGATPYPEGKNDAFLRAAEDAGIRYLASDTSQPNQNREQFIPGFDILLLPRHPTALFYNVTKPATLRDEYNYMFYESYLENGQNPATAPGAEPELRSYQQILNLDAELAVKNMLSYSIWPHYFHQSNLRDYNNKGKTLLFDWLETVFKSYEQLTTLPVISLPYYEVGRRTENRLAARKAEIVGTWNLEPGTVTLSAKQKVDIFVTGIGGGETYGGQNIRAVSVGPLIQNFHVDRALEY